MYIHICRLKHHLLWFRMVTTNCFVGKNTPEKKLQNIQEARAGGIVPRQVNIQRQFTPTNHKSKLIKEAPPCRFTWLV